MEDRPCSVPGAHCQKVHNEKLGGRNSSTEMILGSTARPRYPRHIEPEPLLLATLLPLTETQQDQKLKVDQKTTGID
jgi:hypothetical protein